jgi:hypothetical protein
LNPASIATESSTRADVTVFVSNDGRSPDGSNTKAYASIADAITAAVDAAAALGKVDVACVRIAPGTYAERVVVQPFAASCGALVIESMDGKSESVTLEHFTSTPYEATLEAAPGCTGLAVHNLTIRHGSKSVANNYAVFAQGGSSLTLTGLRREIGNRIRRRRGRRFDLPGTMRRPRLPHARYRGVRRPTRRERVRSRVKVQGLRQRRGRRVGAGRSVGGCNEVRGGG